MKKIFNILLLLLITNIIIPQKYNNISDSHTILSNKIRIYGNVQSFEIRYDNFKKDCILLIINDKDYIKVQTLPSNFISDDKYKCYSLYDDNVERYVKGKRVYEIKSNYHLQFLLNPNYNITNPEIIITFYDDTNLIIKL